MSRGPIQCLRRRAQSLPCIHGTEIDKWYLPGLSPLDSELSDRMRVVGLMLLALVAAANGLQAGFRPLPATVATVTARAPVVLAQENSPFAKLANVPAPALAASFTGTGLVVVVRVALLERTVCACLLPRSSCAAGGTGIFNSRPAGCRTLCGRRHQPAEAGPGLAGRGMSLPRAQRPAPHQVLHAV